MMLYNRKKAQSEIAAKSEILKQFHHANVVVQSMLQQIEDTVGKGVGDSNNIKYLVQRSKDSFSSDGDNGNNSLSLSKQLKPSEQIDFLKALYGAKQDDVSSSLQSGDSSYQVYDLKSSSGSLAGYFAILKEYTFKVTAAMSPGLGGAFNAIFRHQLAAGDYDFRVSEAEQSEAILIRLNSSALVNEAYKPASNLNKTAHYNYCLQDKSLSNAYCELLEESQASMFEELFLAQ